MGNQELPRRGAPQRAESKAESKILWNDGRSPQAADYFTFGYEGRRLDDIKTVLLSGGARTVLDIRYNPFNMYRPEVSKHNLQKSIEADAHVEHRRAVLSTSAQHARPVRLSGRDFEDKLGHFRIQMATRPPSSTTSSLTPSRDEANWKC